MIRRLARMGLVVALAWSSAGPAWGAGSVSPPPSPESVRDYLSGLSDAELGALVRGRLDTGRATGGHSGQDLATATSAVDQFRGMDTQTVLTPADLKTGTLIYPYEKAK